LFQQFIDEGDMIAVYYEQREFGKALRAIMDLADKANQRIDAEKPWNLIKDPEHVVRAHAVCSLGLNLFRLLTLYLKPVLPVTAQKVEAFFNSPALTWADRSIPLGNQTIQTFEPLLQRIPPEALAALQVVPSEA